MPKVAVIIITYNRAKLLCRALDSVLAQSEKDWIVWVIDDGSTDNSREVVAEYQKIDSRVHYHYQENGGEASARNKGIALAQATYITFLDSDDAYETDHLRHRLQILEKNPNIDLLHGGVRIVGNAYVPDRHQPKKLIHLSKCVIGATFFMRPEGFVRLGLYHKMPIGTDADLFERAEKAGYTIQKTAHPSYIYYRDSTDSLTTKYQQEQQKPEH